MGAMSCLVAQEDDHSGLWDERPLERLPLRVLRGWTLGAIEVHLLQGRWGDTNHFGDQNEAVPEVRSREVSVSEAGGAPVVMEPSTLVEPLIQGTEGVFCPKVLDSYTGRFEYENVATGDKLTFGRDGRWCVGSDCSAPMGGATPVGSMMATHQVRFLSWVYGVEHCKLE